MFATWPRPIFGLLLLAAIAPAAGAATPTLGGQYESNPNRFPTLALVIHQEGGTASGSLTIIGDARAMRVVAIPVEGTVRRAQLAFNWEDNYGNAGTATFRADGKQYLLKSKLTRRSNDGRYFEGDFRLKRTGNDPGKTP